MHECLRTSKRARLQASLVSHMPLAKSAAHLPSL